MGGIVPPIPTGRNPSSKPSAIQGGRLKANRKGSRQFADLLGLGSGIGLCLLFNGCFGRGSSTVPLSPPNATICTRFSYPMPTPPSLPAGSISVGGSTGLPPGFSVNPDGFILAGYPDGSQFGSWPITVNASQGGRAFTVTGVLEIPPPTASYSPRVIVVGARKKATVPVTITITPECAYLVTLASKDANLVITPIYDTAGSSEVKFTINSDNDTTERAFTIVATIASKAPGQAPVTMDINGNVR
jgi:hypothetical protein